MDIPPEAIAYGTAAATWLWESFGKELVKGGAGKLKDGSGKAFSEATWKRGVEKYYKSLFSDVAFIQVLGKQEQEPLEGIFTDVNILSRQTAELRYGRKNIPALFEETTRRWRYGERVRRHMGAYALENYEKLFVLGKPGAGKTTFMKWTALQAIEGELQKVPIFVRLRELAQVMPNLHTRDEILDYIVDNAVFRLPAPRDFVTRVLRDGKAVVLFDGLDEVNQNNDQRRNLIAAIKRFVQQYDESQFLITCRVAATDYSFPQFEYVEMADFSDDQIHNFIQKWFAGDGVKYEACKEQLLGDDKLDTLHELAQVPLLLSLLCLVFEERGEFPNERAEIYDEATRALLSKWDASRNIRRPTVYKQLSVKRKRQLLGHIAAKVFADGDIVLPEERWVALIEGYMQTLPGAEEADGHSVLREIAAQHGLIVERAKRYYSFSHLTLQEFFTSEWIVAKEAGGSLRLLCEHVGEDRWKEVFLLTAQLLEDGKPFAQHYLNALGRLLDSSAAQQQVLKWTDAKRVNANAPYQNAAVRAFYVYLDALDRDIERVRDRDLERDLDLDRTRALALDSDFTPARERDYDLDRALDLDRARTLALDLDLDFTHHGLDLALSLDLNLTLSLDLVRDLARDREQAIKCAKKLNLTSLHEGLEFLEDSLANRYSNASVWHEWGMQLRKLSIAERDVGHRRDWGAFSAEKWSRYLVGNIVFVECVHMMRMSVEQRQTFKDAMLLHPVPAVSDGLSLGS